MKSFFQIIVLFIPVFVVGQNKISNIVNSEIVVNYPDSTVKASIYLKNIKLNPKQNLIYYWYNSDRINRNMGGYSGRLLDGTYKVFDLNKNLIAEGSYKKGLRNGIWKRWNNKGGLLNLNNYKNGIKQGKEFVYDRTGKVIFIGKFKNGLKNGKCLILTNDTLKELYFKKDIVVINKNVLSKVFSKVTFKKNEVGKVDKENRNEEVKGGHTNQNELSIDKSEKVEESKSAGSIGKVKKEKKANKIKNNKPEERKLLIND